MVLFIQCVKNAATSATSLKNLDGLSNKNESNCYLEQSSLFIVCFSMPSSQLNVCVYFDASICFLLNPNVDV